MDLRPVFSRAKSAAAADSATAEGALPDPSIVHVQHRLAAERSTLADALARGAHFYLCGDGDRLAPAVRDTVVRMYADANAKSLDEAHAWFDAMKDTNHGRQHAARIAVDVSA